MAWLIPGRMPELEAGSAKGGTRAGAATPPPSTPGTLQQASMTREGNIIYSSVFSTTNLFECKQEESTAGKESTAGAETPTLP